MEGLRLLRIFGVSVCLTFDGSHSPGRNQLLGANVRPCNPVQWFGRAVAELFAGPYYWLPHIPNCANCSSLSTAQSRGSPMFTNVRLETPSQVSSDTPLGQGKKSATKSAASVATSGTLPGHSVSHPDGGTSLVHESIKERGNSNHSLKSTQEWRSPTQDKWVSNVLT